MRSTETTEFRGEEAWVGVTAEAMPIQAMSEWVSRPHCGAVVTFSGVVRDHSVDAHGVASISYEAYVPTIAPRLLEITGEARIRWPDLGRLAMIHRIGDVALGESSVFVAVSSPHRPAAFAAARFCIDVLKRSVAVWKLEHAESGARWVETGIDVESVAVSAALWDDENGRTQDGATV
jgi:molybdopterin synthase catalytic subunit